MKSILLCTDLDRTLIPNGSQPESEGARRLFSRLAATEFVKLAYVSGRHKALITDAIRAYGLPVPDFAIADVGSTIYQICNGQWQRWQQWDHAIADDWRGYCGTELHGLLSDISALQLQEPEKQNRFKLSYYLPLTADRQLIMTDINNRLHAAHIQVNIIWSVDEEKNIGLVDILPAGANKLHAITFLMQQCGFDSSQTVFAGDSGNDLDVLISPIQSVLVANADSEVRDAVLVGKPHMQHSFYQAQGGFLGMNGNYSAGILEGVAYFRPEFKPLLEELSHE